MHGSNKRAAVMIQAPSGTREANAGPGRGNFRLEFLQLGFHTNEERKQARRRRKRQCSRHYLNSLPIGEIVFFAGHGGERM